MRFNKIMVKTKEERNERNKKHWCTSCGNTLTLLLLVQSQLAPGTGLFLGKLCGDNTHGSSMGSLGNGTATHSRACRTYSLSEEGHGCEGMDVERERERERERARKMADIAPMQSVPG